MEDIMVPIILGILAFSVFWLIVLYFGNKRIKSIWSKIENHELPFRFTRHVAKLKVNELNLTRLSLFLNYKPFDLFGKGNWYAVSFRDIETSESCFHFFMRFFRSSLLAGSDSHSMAQVNVNGLIITVCSSYDLIYVFYDSKFAYSFHFFDGSLRGGFTGNFTKPDVLDAFSIISTRYSSEKMVFTLSIENSVVGSVFLDRKAFIQYPSLSKIGSLALIQDVRTADKKLKLVLLSFALGIYTLNRCQSDSRNVRYL